MTRDILDYNGTKIGELVMPDNTPEYLWQEKLSVYSKPPPSQQETMIKYLEKSISDRRIYSEQMLERFKKRNMLLSPSVNIAQALWMHHRMRAIPVVFMHPVLTGGEVLNLTLDILNLAIPGDIEVACVALQCIPPDELDDMSKPYHFFNSATRDWIVADMKSFLGWT